MRIFRKYKAQDWLAVRRAMASPGLTRDNDETHRRSVQTRERFETGLNRAGVTDPTAFMRQRPDTSDYPGAWALWLRLDAE